MQLDLAEKIYERVKALDTQQQEEVLKLVERKLSKPAKADSRPIWEVITEISSEIPLEEWETLPSDGSVNHDHYLYGAPKKY
ncbi:MAG: hypothetical protein ACRD6X_05410 [Pyrinomonadaceae bacterium]